MDIWAKVQPKDREALFSQTAAVKGITPEIIEKDFWVCWVLRALFSMSTCATPASTSKNRENRRVREAEPLRVAAEYLSLPFSASVFFLLFF